MNAELYDLLILGGGPAGLSAALYASRARLRAAVLHDGGGQVTSTPEIENYLGIDSIDGFELDRLFTEHAKRMGAELLTVRAEKLTAGDMFCVETRGGLLRTKAVVLAMGATHRELGLESERRLFGSGVSYCATCDGNFFEDMDIFVVGGGDSAVEEALYLTKFGRKVTLIHRRDALRAAKSIQEKAFANPKMDFMWDTVVEELKGDDILTSMVVKNVKTGEVKEIEANPDDGTFGVLVFIGYDPQSKVFEGKVNMEHGYIVTDADMKTNIPGVFAAGDIRVKSLRQVVTAAADGAIAAVQCEKYLG